MSYILLIILCISTILLYKKNSTKNCSNCNTCKMCEVKK